MRNKISLLEGIVLILVGGSILFSAGYFLPDTLAYQGATFIGGLVGYIIFVRFLNWQIESKPIKNLFLFLTTILMSSLASLCLIGICYISSDLPICYGNRFKGFIMTDFFFPMLIVFFSWISFGRSNSHSLWVFDPAEIKGFYSRKMNGVCKLKKLALKLLSWASFFVDM